MSWRHLLALLLCVLAPAAAMAWEAHRAAKRDRKHCSWSTSRDPGKDTENDNRPLSFLDDKNAHNLLAWKRRWIQVHPQTIVTQRFPSPELVMEIEYPHRSRAVLEATTSELPALLRKQAH